MIDTPSDYYVLLISHHLNKQKYPPISPPPAVSFPVSKRRPCCRGRSVDWQTPPCRTPISDAPEHSRYRVDGVVYRAEAPVDGPPPCLCSFTHVAAVLPHCSAVTSLRPMSSTTEARATSCPLCHTVASGEISTTMPSSRRMLLPPCRIASYCRRYEQSLGEMRSDDILNCTSARA